MLKDYLPVSSDLEDKPELDRVDAFWSSVWEGQKITPELVRSKVENSDEYKVIGPYLDCLPAGARILDGGCGMGEWVNYLKDRNFSPVGLDISSSTVERLRTTFSDTEWVVGDINALNYEDKSFDAYISWGTFEHFEAGLRKPISEAYRILKPGGYLFITVPQDSLRLFFQKFGASWQNEQHKEHTSYAFYQWRLTKNEIAFEIQQEAFDIRSITPIHKAQGIGRLYKSVTGMKTDGALSARFIKALSIISPGTFAGHMLFVVAQKRK